MIHFWLRLSGFRDVNSLEHSGPEAADDESYVEECHQRVLDAMQLALDQLMQERRLMRREQLRAGLHRATHVFSRATHG
ncbi:MAG: hypothetical protein JRJ10_15950 [Deltaproteobacteria bacterium]|nr:hypothetical protein [Deltaproteobacteria bacterium]